MFETTKNPLDGGRMLSSQQLMKKEYPKVNPNQTISKTSSLFKEESNRSIIVEENKKFKGMIMESDIMKSKVPPQTKVKNFIIHTPTLSYDDNVGKIAHLMIENNLYQLPVVKNDKVGGIVYADDILKRFTQEEFGEQSIKKYMNIPSQTLKPDEKISKAIKNFKHKDINALPVTENNKVLGLLPIENIIDKVVHPENRPEGPGEHGEYIAEKKEHLNLPVRDIMSENITIVSPDTKVKNVFKKMNKTKQEVFLVGSHNDLKGMINRRDLLYPISKLQKEKTSMIIQFSGELEEIKGFNKRNAKNKIYEILEKYEEHLKNSNIVVHLKKRDKTRHGLHLIECKIRVVGPEGKFIATDEGWGFLHAIRETSSAIEKQIRREKRR